MKRSSSASNDHDIKRTMKRSISDQREHSTKRFIFSERDGNIVNQSVTRNDEPTTKRIISERINIPLTSNDLRNGVVVKGSSIEVTSSALCDDDISFDGDSCLSDNDDEISLYDDDISFDGDSSLSDNDDKISLYDDDISFDGNSCLSENAKLPSDDDNKRTMSPKVFAFLRMSPRTVNDGSFQKRFIEASCQYLINVGVFQSFDAKNGINFFVGRGVSRRHLMMSRAFQRMMSSIEANTVEDDSIIVVISSLDRIATEEQKINKIIGKILSVRPNVRFVSMKEYGFDPWRASNVLSSYHLARKQITKEICNHIDPGSSFDILPVFKEEQHRITSEAERLKENWSNNGLDEWIVNAVKNGEEPHRSENEVLHWIRSRVMGRGGLVQVAEIDRIAGSSLLSDSSHDGDQQVLIYQRTSPQSRVKNVDGLPEHQLAMSVSFLNLSERLSKMRDRAIIYEENLPRQTRTRPGMIRLIARILSGEVSDVIITCPNRVSSDEFALFFEAVCTRMNTKIHCAANVGLKYSDVVKRDMQRLESNQGDAIDTSYTPKSWCCA